MGLEQLEDDSVTLELHHGKVRRWVRRSTEFDRVHSLPNWESAPNVNFDHLYRGTMRLRPKQKEALIQAFFSGGLFAPLGVGEGKTLIATLLPTVLNRQAVILTSAPLVSQTDNLIQEYSNHFNLTVLPTIVSYGYLSVIGGADVLEKLQPKLIVADECHELRNRNSTRTKRFLRYMKANPSTLFCAMSGTVTNRSIKDFAHLLELALGPGSPLPRSWPELTEWAEALDVSDTPIAPGVLMELTPGATTARGSWRGRFTRTMGVCASEEHSLGTSLLIEIVPAPKSPTIEHARKLLARTWTRPDGEELVTALEFARVDRQLRLGGYYRWKTQPPDVWLSTRSAWHRALREFLRHRAKPGLDSPLLVARAIAKGELTQLSPVYENWVRMRERFPEPETEWLWIDADYLGYISIPEKSLVWTDVVAVGKMLGLPYFGAGDDRILEETGERSIAASIRANGTGRNLQMFSRNFILSAPPTGKVWEQLIGRTHRQGQDADLVEVRVLSSFLPELEAAAEDAAYIESITGNRQRLLYANRKGW